MRPRTPVRFSFCISILILACSVAACAWAIFTSGAVTQEDAPPPVLVPDSMIVLDNAPSWVLVDLVMPDGDGYEDSYVLIKTPPEMQPPDTFYAPLLTVLDPDGRYNDHRFILLDGLSRDLVEIEIGELLEDWSPWEADYFNLNDH